jgi:hypothetical protein
MTDDKQPRQKEPKSRLVWDIGSLIILGVMVFGASVLIRVLIAAFAFSFFSN